MTRAYSYVRFSTPAQAEGDSERRQIELSERWAAQHDLELDDTHRFTDLGVSAYHGLNAADGALGAFIETVKSGVIPSGSYLLVENLDRLSRARVTDAFNLFQSLLDLEINVVTLSDGRVYSRDSLNTEFTDLLVSLSMMFRAHEESRLKGERVAAAWSDLREQARSGKPITGRCPAWLKLSDDRSHFVVIEERAEVVRKVFDMALDGLGMQAIARSLMRQGVSPFTKRGIGWQHSSVYKLLNNASVFGQYQPHRMVTDNETGRKRRIPDGDPIDGYFPEVIPRALFLRAQDAIRSRLNHGGRKGKGFSNLLSNLCACGECGQSMWHVNKGMNKGGGRLLVCGTAHRGAGCRWWGWRYPAVEQFVLQTLAEVSLEELLPRATETTKVALEELQNRAATTDAAIVENATAIKNITDAIQKAPASDALLSTLAELEIEKVELEDQQAATAATLADVRAAAADVEKHHGAVFKEVREWLKANEDESEAFERRARMNSLLRRTVERVVFHPAANKKEDQHGWIEILFRGVDAYKRVIEVSKDQKGADSYRLWTEEPVASDGEVLPAVESHGTVIRLKA